MRSFRRFGEAFGGASLRSSKSGENLYKIEMKIFKCFIYSGGR